MDPHEYHRLFAGKTTEEIRKKYNELRMTPDILGDVLYYCCIITVDFRDKLKLSQAMDNTTQDGFHPDVTPEMIVDFILAFRMPWTTFRMMRRFCGYKNFREALDILLSKSRYYAYTTDLGTTVGIEHCAEYLPPDRMEINADQFIFLIDFHARGNRPLLERYPLSEKYDVSVDYFWLTPDSIINKCVDEYKQLCIENTKTC